MYRLNGLIGVNPACLGEGAHGRRSAPVQWIERLDRQLGDGDYRAGCRTPLWCLRNESSSAPSQDFAAGSMFAFPRACQGRICKPSIRRRDRLAARRTKLAEERVAGPVCLVSRTRPQNPPPPLPEVGDARRGPFRDVGSASARSPAVPSGSALWPAMRGASASLQRVFPAGVGAVRGLETHRVDGGLHAAHPLLAEAAARERAAGRGSARPGSRR